MRITVGDCTFEAKFASILHRYEKPELVFIYKDSRSMADIVRTWDGNEKIITENQFGDVQEHLGFTNIHCVVRESDTEVYVGLTEGGARNGD